MIRLTLGNIGKAVPLLLDAKVWPQFHYLTYKAGLNWSDQGEDRLNPHWALFFSYVFAAVGAFIGPQVPHHQKGQRSIDFVVMKAAQFLGGASYLPIGLVEIKDVDADLGKPSMRLSFDSQIRDRMETLVNDCPLPVLYGISIVGDCMRLYQAQDRLITPEAPAINAVSPPTISLMGGVQTSFSMKAYWRCRTW